jgi:hypothetical protein
LQGSTIKLLVKVLDIQLSKAKECKLCADIQETVLSHVLNIDHRL